MVIGKNTHEERRTAHQQQRQHEGELTTDKITEMSEHYGAERTHDEAGPEDAEAGQQGHRLVAGRKEVLAEEHGQDAIDIEIVPLDEGADGRGPDDERQTQLR